MERTRILIIVLLGVAAAGCGAEAEGPADSEGAVAETAVLSVTPDMVRQGRTAYRKYCVQCHGYGGKGDGTSSGSFDPPPRDHTNAELMDPISDQMIAETVRFGGMERGFPNMPAFAQVSRDELVALVAYVRSLSRPDTTEISVGEIQ